MPDDKFSNLSQADEMVPMDTEGDGVEIALPEEAADEAASVVEDVQEEAAQPEVSAAEQEQEEYSKMKRNGLVQAQKYSHENIGKLIKELLNE